MRFIVRSFTICFAVMILCGAAPAPTVFFVNSTLDTDDANVGGVFDSSCDDGAGNCTVRAAIEEANAAGGGGVVGIDFDFPGSGPYVTTLQSALPTINVSVMIDGLTQSGATCDHPLVVINVNNIFHGGLHVEGGGSTIRGLEIMNVGGDTTLGYGVHVQSDNNLIECVYAHDNWGGVVLAGNNNTARNNSALVNRFSGVTTYGNNNVATTNICEGNQQGLYSEGGNNNLFESNEVFGNANVGMFVKDGVTNTTIHNNDMHDQPSGILDRGAATVIAQNRIMGTNATDINSSGLDLAVNPATVTENEISGFFIGIMVESSGQSLQMNAVSGNEHGILVIGMGDTQVTNVLIQANAIVMNSAYGVSMVGNVDDILIGGKMPAFANTIANNGNAGVSTFDWISGMYSMPPGGLGTPGSHIAVLGNSISNNGDGGIELVASGEDVTPSPTLLVAKRLHNGFVLIKGLLAADALQSYRLEIFANQTSDAEGEAISVVKSIETHGTGRKKFRALLSVASGECVTATASLNQSGQFSTSQFSSCLMIP